MSTWTEHIKSHAAKHGLNYASALRDPKCKESYSKLSKPSKVGKPKMVKIVEEIKPTVIEPTAVVEPTPVSQGVGLEISEKKSRGRPKKYSTAEEAKTAKSVSSMASNKRAKIPKPILSTAVLPVESPMDGGALCLMPEGGMIYPLSNHHVAAMLKHM